MNFCVLSFVTPTRHHARNVSAPGNRLKPKPMADGFVYTMVRDSADLES